MARSRSQPVMIAFNPICRMRHSTVLYPVIRSPFKYASMSLLSVAPSISLRTIFSQVAILQQPLYIAYVAILQPWLPWEDSGRKLTRVA